MTTASTGWALPGAARSADAACRLAGIAAAQSGMFTRAQALRCGYSRYQVRRRLETGCWRRVLGPVLAEPGLRLTPFLRDLAALLALEGAVLAGPSAARRLGIPTSDPRTYVVVGPGRRAALPGVRLLCEPVHRRDIAIADGILFTGAARTVFDCLRVLPDPQALDLLDRALQAGWLTAAELAVRVRGYAGRRGAARLARFSRLAGAGTRSAAERVAAALLRRAGVTGWRANAPIYDHEGLIGLGDLVFDGARLVVEFDGRAHHVTPVAFQRDRTRQNRLVAAGWTVLRFTWADLTVRPGEVIAAIRAAHTRHDR